MTRGPDEQLEPGRWTVDGVHIGGSLAEVEALLGPGEQHGFAEAAPVYRFANNDTAVTFDSEGNVAAVSGKTLLRDGQVVLATGQGPDAVVSALGKGYTIERFSPKSYGIFTTGSVPNGVEHYYHDGANRFHVFVNRKDVIGGIHCAPMDKFPLPER